MYSFDLLEKFAKNVCIISRNSADDSVYTYDEVIKGAKDICQQFQNFQVPKSACLAINLNGHTAGSISLLIAILNHHCHFYPLQDCQLSDELNDCGASFLVSNNECTKEAQILQLKGELQIFDENFLLYIVRNPSRIPRFPENMCYTISTSGSTGRPKMVHVPYDCIAPNIYALSERLKITANDVIFLGTPFTFDPFVVEFFSALLCGASLLITNSRLRLAPSKLLDLLWPKNSNLIAITILQTTPSIFRQFGDDAIRDVILAKESSLRVLILGGEEFPKIAVIRKWLQDDNVLHKKIFNIYGITEISCWSTIHELKTAQLWNEKKIPIGEPIDNETYLRIAKLTEEESYGVQRGELLIGSSTRRTLIPELDDADHNVDRSKDLLYRHTGDLVERNEAGDVYYVGRLNNVIKRMGKRINLDALEEKIEQLFASTDNLKVICLWNPLKKCLFCCIHRYNIEMEDKQIFCEKKKFVMQNLLNYEKPDWIVEIQQLPLNMHGKIDRKKLLEITNTPELSHPVNIFKHFLIETLTLPIIDETRTFLTSKRIKSESSNDCLKKSFSTLGGTSFNALSISTEIGKFLKNPNDQRRLLEILLDPSISIADIIIFLENTPSCEKLEVVTKVNNPLSQKLEQLWRIDMQKCVDATPAVDFEQRFVCIGSHAHLLITVDTFHGKEISRLKLRGRIECEVAFISNDAALIGCNSGYLYAFHFLSGELYWSLLIGSKVKAKPLVIDTSNAIIGYYDENFNTALICLKTQQIKWRRKIGNKSIFSSPISLDKKTVLLCTLDGTFERVNILTGCTLWTRKCASPIFSTPTIIDNGQLFCIAEVGGKVHICKNENGEILQTFSAEGNLFSNITAFNDNDTSTKLFFGCHDHHVYCLSNTQQSIDERKFPNFMLKCKIKLNSAIYATPKVINFNQGERYIIACSTEGNLVVLDSCTGLQVATHKLEGEVFSTPCIIRNSKNEIRIYLGCRDNYFYCFQLK